MVKVIGNKGKGKRHIVTVVDTAFFGGKSYYNVCIASIGKELSVKDVNKRFVPLIFAKKSKWKTFESKDYTHIAALEDYPHLNIFIKETIPTATKVVKSKEKTDDGETSE